MAVVNKSILGLCPFQRYVWTFLAMICKKTAIYILAFFFKHTNLNFNASLAYPLYSATLHLCKRVKTTYYDASYSLAYNQVGTWGSLSVVSAWLKTNIYSCFWQQMLILFFNAAKSINLSMGFAATYVIALTYYPAVGNDHSPDHRIRPCLVPSATSQLQTTHHVFLVCCHNRR